MKNTMNSGVSKALRNIVAERDSYTCVLCDNGYTDMHHVTPRSRGGRNNPYNLVCLCRSCHMMLHHEINFLPAYWECMGWESLSEWHEQMTQRMIEYVCDYYAEDIESGDFNPIDHDRFTIYGD